MTAGSPEKYLLIGKESTWGTAVTADKDSGLIIQDIADNFNREVIESQGISSIQTQKVSKGLVDPGHTLTGHIQHGRMFEFLIGAASHAETTGDWKHTFSVDNTAPSCTIESGENIGGTDTVLTGDGMLAESGELSIEVNGVLTLAVTLKGKDMASSTSASASVLSTLAVFPHPDCTIEVNGAAATEVQSASISINKVVSRSGGIGSESYQQGKSTELKFAYTATLGFDDDTYQALAVAGTVHDFLLSADNGIALGSGRREVYLELENCVNNVMNKTASVGNLVFVELSGIGTLKSSFSVDNISSANWF